jgi:hypothetical protein
MFTSITPQTTKCTIKNCWPAAFQSSLYHNLSWCTWHNQNMTVSAGDMVSLITNILKSACYIYPFEIKLKQQHHEKHSYMLFKNKNLIHLFINSMELIV